MFPDTATFVSPDFGTETRRDPDPNYSGDPTYSGAAYVEAANATAVRQEIHDLPEGVQTWAVFTPSNPGALVDSKVTWGDLILRSLATAQPQGGGIVWRTWCRQIN